MKFHPSGAAVFLFPLAGLGVWVCIALCALSAPAAAATLWVDATAAAVVPDGSPTAPFLSITAATKAAKPGDTVLIRSGIYREQVRLPSGMPGQPITLRAAERQRVIVTAATPVEEWSQTAGGLWTTTVDEKPERLFVGRRSQPLAREPNQGWWKSQSAREQEIVAPGHLRDVGAQAVGGEVRVWLQRGNTFFTYDVQQHRPDDGALVVSGGKRGLQLSDGDRFHLQNRKAWIDRPGEWAVEPEGNRFRLYFKPTQVEDLKHTEVPVVSGSLVTGRRVKHVRIEGLEITASRRYGIEVQDGEDVQVRRCVAYHNQGTGISLRAVNNGLVAQNIAWHNGNGISVSYSSAVVVEENDVGYNQIDGILVTWKSSDITVRRNCVHHHLLWGHPDNMQVYRGVSRVRFLDNLLLAAGQSVMTEETTDGQFAGNMVIGSAANMLIFGHENAGKYRISNNTLAFSGYGCMSLTWRDYEVRENVFMTGHAGGIYGVRGVEGYKADRNLFFNTERAEQPMILVTDAGWLKDFDKARASTGQDEHSVYANPQFRNAPLAFGVLDSKRLDECTRSTWYLRSGTSLFRQDDHVEVNFDGVVRRITSMDDATITVEPPLAELPVKGWLVACWGPQTDFHLDLRLRDDSSTYDNSPGRNLAADGGPVGATLDIQAYLRGDFNGDGQRDLPELPRDW